MSINDQYDMSVFDGTEFEGMTYLQVRRRMTPQQVARFNVVKKRSRAAAKMIENTKRHAIR